MTEAVPASDARAGRPLGGLALLALGVNGIVGVGIFFVPADVARAAPGGASVVVLALTALGLFPVALCFAALGARFDEDGGPVVYARAAFGSTWGFMVGWITYVSAVASTSAIAYGLASAVLGLLGRDGLGLRRVTATLLVTLLALVCASGLRVSSRTWTALTALKLVPLLALVAAWLVVGGSGGGAEPAAASPDDVSWLRAALLATFAYQGFEIVPVLAGHARSPTRFVPLATVGSLAVAAVLYVGLQAAAVAALPGLGSSAAPLAEAATALGGASLGGLITAGTSLSALGIAVGMLAATPHYLAATARGGTLPFGLEEFDARAVPRRALFATWLLVCVLVQAGTRTELFALSSAAVLTQYVATAASLFVLARRAERGLAGRHALLALPAIVVGLSLVAGTSAREASIAALAVAIGLVLRGVARASVRAA